MNVLIVYCHPSKNSFTNAVRESFIKGLTDGGHTYEQSDLYAMEFNPVFSESEYRREAYYDTAAAVSDDVITEQEKINRADAIAFIYPVFWTECPALLTGWFQRVFTYGFAYGEKTMKVLEQAFFLVTMGGSQKDPIRQEQIQAMKTVMIGDRLHDRAKRFAFTVFDEMTRGYGNDDNRAERFKEFVQQAYTLGKNCDAQ
ncbi:MAG: NAD(P)H-dependent oxidoreductase [Oscillospiraceae bacterium]